jgi:DNA replication and repair protein RecF
MQLKTLSIRNFRNYKDLTLNFNKNINIFVGNNAEGKTNLLESIYVLAITKSHRMYIDNNLIMNNEIFTKIKGRIKTKEEEKDLEILINSNGKSVKINNIIIKKISDYISKFTVIIFCPDDLEIVKGSPNIRRKFLNIEIGQLNNKYLNILNDYNLILKNRNEYLRKSNINNIDSTYIEVITHIWAFLCFSFDFY